ncbi:unnamed protein product, partial [Ectocarpus sp. 12 AP-2014]
CLLDAKAKKADCTLAFLDVSKAFDKVGHGHIEACLDSQGVSSNLKRAIMRLLVDNQIVVQTGRQRSDPIPIRRSVPQGGPLSPTLFNMAVNHIYEEVCEPQYANQFGYSLHPDLDAVSLTGFADDKVVSSKSTEGAAKISKLVKDGFLKIGLEINPRKSTGIQIRGGRMFSGQIEIGD